MNSKLEAPEGLMNGKVFNFPIRIYYEDTDAGGIVYYANYLKFAERTRTEYLRHLGVASQQDILDQDQCGFVVRHLEIDYRLPAKLDDFLVVTCEVIEAKGAGITMRQQVLRNNEILAEMTVKAAYVSLSRKRPIRIPENLLSKMQISD